jgi:hypothetical protein
VQSRSLPQMGFSLPIYPLGDRIPPLAHADGCRFGIPAIIASCGGSVIDTASNVALMGNAIAQAATMDRIRSHGGRVGLVGPRAGPATRLAPLGH